MSESKPAQASDPSGDHDKLTEQIQHTRDELGAAVHELAAKTDVKRRVADQAGQQAERVRNTARQVAKQASRTRDQIAEQIVEPAGQVKDAVAADSRSRLLLATLSAASAVLAGILIWRRRSGR